MTHDQLVNFAVKYDVPNCWVERAKEDYPYDVDVVINKVFFEWWDRCNLNVGKKLRILQTAFVYMGKPAVFNRILDKYPDMQILLEYASLNRWRWCYKN